MRRNDLTLLLIIGAMLIIFGFIAIVGCNAEASQFETCYTTADSLNCRAEPNAKANIVAKFPRGTQLQAIGCDGGKWIQVWNGSVQGWCHMAYLNFGQSTYADNQSVYGKYLGDFKISYYTTSPAENGGGTKTAKGQRLTDVVGICIAADPKVIPYYSKVYIEGIGVRTVLDCGGAIKGNRIDLLVSSKKDIPKCGVHYSKVYLVE